MADVNVSARQEKVVAYTERWPSTDEISAWTDHYFTRTKAVIARHGDQRVTYAIFMRRPVVAAPRLLCAWLEGVTATHGYDCEITLCFEEGRLVGAGQPLLYLSGSLLHLIELETLILQKLGACCVAAYNAYTMCAELPDVDFIAMDARHCCGTEMAEMMAYAACVGSARARRKAGARGFVANATAATAHFFSHPAVGSMPHAFVGYAGSTLKAAELFVQNYPEQPLTVLIDYFGKEITDGLAVCTAFAQQAAEGRLTLRLDTLGSRFVQGLDLNRSYSILARRAPHSIRGYREERELNDLVGPGVSAAAIWHLRTELDCAGYPRVKLLASSGFTPAKCRMMALAKAPVDSIGSGSFLPERWLETYATADIIAYGDQSRVKLGREFLLPSTRKPPQP